MKILLFVLSLTLLSACANTKRDFVFDGSSAQSTKQSVATINKRLSTDKQFEFTMALIAIQYSEINSVHEIIGDPEMMKGMNYRIIGQKIDGLNYFEVLKLAESSPSKVSLEVQ